MKPSIVKPTGSGRESSSQGEEPRTGVVRKLNAAVSSARPRRPSGVRSKRDWRCLEPSAPERRPSERPSNVSIAQLSTQGERLRQSGPDEWLPEATEFVHRAALLVAQGLGFDRCRSVCLQSAAGVLSVADAGPASIVGVVGPARLLSSVLRKRGLK